MREDKLLEKIIDLRVAEEVRFKEESNPQWVIPSQSHLERNRMFLQTLARIGLLNDGNSNTFSPEELDAVISQFNKSFYYGKEKSYRFRTGFVISRYVGRFSGRGENLFFAEVWKLEDFNELFENLTDALQFMELKRKLAS